MRNKFDLKISSRIMKRQQFDFMKTTAKTTRVNREKSHRASLSAFWHPL